MAGAAPHEGTRVLALPEVDSTNAEAMRRALAGEASPLWITAERQTAGRGRSGRTWSTEKGNLAASLLMPLTGSPADAPRLALVAGIALVDAIDALNAGQSVAGLTLKWPNDLIVDGAKLAGILIESTTISGRAFAVIGIGLNLAVAPEVEGRRTAALRAAISRAVSPREALAAIDAALYRRTRDWQSAAGFAAIRAAWLAAATPQGTAIRIATPQGAVAGSFAGLAEDGALLLREVSGAVRKFSFGDVTLASEREMS